LSGKAYQNQQQYFFLSS